MNYLLTVTLIILFLTKTNAQEKFSLKIATGYAIGFPSETLGMNDHQVYRKKTSPDGSSLIPIFRQQTKAVYGTYGTGLILSLSGNFAFNKNLSIDLTTAWCRPEEKLFIQRNEDRFDEQLIYWSEGMKSSRARLFSLTPGIVYTLSTGKLSPYFITGISMNVISLVNQEEFYSTYPQESQYDYREENFRRKLEFGYRSGMGVKLNLTGKTAVILELIYHSINFNPKEKEVTAFIVNNEDMLPGLTTRERHTHFNKTVTSSTEIPSSDKDQQPTYALPVSFPFSAIHTQLGVKINL